VAVRRPGVVIIKTLVLPLDSRPSDTRYSQTPIRLPMRIILRPRDVTGNVRSVQSAYSPWPVSTSYDAADHPVVRQGLWRRSRAE
jgi:hypothetical protein